MAFALILSIVFSLPCPSDLLYYHLWLEPSESQVLCSMSGFVQAITLRAVYKVSTWNLFYSEVNIPRLKILKSTFLEPPDSPCSSNENLLCFTISIFFLYVCVYRLLTWISRARFIGSLFLCTSSLSKIDFFLQFLVLL